MRLVTTCDSTSITVWICMCGEKFDNQAVFIEHVNRTCPTRLTDQERKDLDLE